uniref:ISXO2-like transposase domain-containing protein n=1 Tax=Acrobeloides nanus TaxID=290746 RepID=A0A914DCE3_9BILA
MAHQLQAWNLIPKEDEYLCPNCGFDLKLNNASDRPDGLRWNCQHKIQKYHHKEESCNTHVEFRYGTWFADAKLDIFQTPGFVNLWVENAPICLISHQLDISLHTCCNWSSFCREVVQYTMPTFNEKLGGENIIVEIDESNYHTFADPHWRCGYTTTNIEEWIHPGSIVMSDFWSAYNTLNRHGYQHLRVKHRLQFKDHETGACTNHIEAHWRASKAIITSGGRRKSQIAGHLAKYLFLYRCEALKLNRTIEFYRLAGQLYDPTKPTQLNLRVGPTEEERNEMMLE